MKAIVTRENVDGTMDEVGMSNRMIVSGLKTIGGIMRRAKVYAGKRHYRIELWYGENIYGKPDKVTTHKWF